MPVGFFVFSFWLQLGKVVEYNVYCCLYGSMFFCLAQQDLASCREVYVFSIISFCIYGCSNVKNSNRVVFFL